MMTLSTATDQITDETAKHGDEPEEAGLIFGRPLEDRSFEAVEAGVGFAAGIAIGSLVAGPIGAAVGALAGAAGGFAAGEALERAVGRAARTIDASDPEPPDRP